MSETVVVPDNFSLFRKAVYYGVVTFQRIQVFPKWNMKS